MTALQVTDAGAVATIRLTKPRLTLADTRDLAAALVDAGATADRRLVVLRGGEDFCLGRDPAGDAREGLTAWAVREAIHGPILGAYEAVRRVPVPIVALVTGRALGFGCALAGACDLTFADPAARFALPEIGAGFAPTLAMSALLPRLGAKPLLHLALAGDEVDAAEARALGLVGRIVPEDGFEAAITLLASRPRAALEAAKTFLADAAGAPPDRAGRLATALLALSRTAQA